MSGNYLNEIINSMESDSDKNYLKALPELLSSQCTHPDQLIEIFGCYRHFGHPIVDELAGVEDFEIDFYKIQFYIFLDNF